MKNQIDIDKDFLLDKTPKVQAKNCNARQAVLCKPRASRQKGKQSIELGDITKWQNIFSSIYLT